MLWPLLERYTHRLLRLWQWFGIATGAAGAVVWLAWWLRDRTLEAALLGVLLLGPGVILWHFAHTLASLLRALTRRPRSLGDGNVLRLGLRLSFLVRPWYWSLLVLSTGAAWLLLPLALWVSLLR